MDWIQRAGGGTRAGGEGRRGGEPADLGGQALAGPRHCQVALSPGTLMGAASASRNVSQIQTFLWWAKRCCRGRLLEALMAASSSVPKSVYLSDQALGMKENLTLASLRGAAGPPIPSL